MNFGSAFAHKSKRARVQVSEADKATSNSEGGNLEDHREKRGGVSGFFSTLFSRPAGSSSAPNQRRNSSDGDNDDDDDDEATNVVAVTFSDLAQGAALATGDPVECKDCKAVLK